MNDLELIYLIRESKNKDAFYYLLEKYWDKIFCYTFKWYSSTKWLSYFIDKNEMNHLLYIAFLKLTLETNIKKDYYIDNFVPKLWFLISKNIILTMNRSLYHDINNFVNCDAYDFDRTNVNKSQTIISNYPLINDCTFSNDIFVEYILELTNKFLKDNNIRLENKNWIIEKISSGGSRIVFDNEKFSEKDKIKLWREYKKTKTYLKNQITKIIN